MIINYLHFGFGLVFSAAGRLSKIKVIIIDLIFFNILERRGFT